MPWSILFLFEAYFLFIHTQSVVARSASARCYLHIKVLFIVLSLAAALLLPISRIIEVKSLPTRRDSATLHSGVTDYHYLLIIPFIRVSIINFDHGE